MVIECRTDNSRGRLEFEEMDVMDTSDYSAQPFVFREPHQKEVYSLLRQLIGEGPASFYKDLCSLVEVSVLETSAHLAAHCMREIESAICRVVETIPDRTARLAQQTETEEVGLKARILLCLRALKTTRLTQQVETDENRNKLKILSCLHALSIPEDSDLARTWLKIPRRWNKYVHRKDLSKPRGVDKDFKTLFDDFTLIIGEILRAFQNVYSSVYRDIDALINKDKPSKADIKELRNNIPRNYVSMKYLFENLTSPAWLPKLNTGGFFSDQPEPEFDEELQQLTIQPWPQSKYLARMAPLAPELVTQIIADFPETENVWIIEDLLDAILSMPPETGASVIESVLRWVEVKNTYVLPDKFALLSDHLARANYVDQSLQLLECLLQIDEVAETPVDGMLSTSVRHQPKAGFEIWHYEQILRKQFIVVAQIAGPRAVDLLSNILESAILYLPYSDHETGEDHSFMWWQPDESEQHGYREITGVLATGVKDAAIASVKSNPDSLGEILSSLNTKRWLVFKRIALRLLDAIPALAREKVVETLLTRNLYQDEDLSYEFYLLAEKHIQELSPSQQEQVLAWIEEGPSEDEAEFVNIDDRMEYREKWILARLNLLKDLLPQTTKQRYEDLIERHGEPPALELPITSVAWTGAISPIEADALANLSVEKLVHYLETWEPSGDLMGPSVSGLCRELTNVVGQNPSVFSTEAGKFMNLDVTYIRALITGLQDAVKEQKAIDWSSILDLCLWIVQHRDDTTGSDAELFERDQTYGPCRQAVTMLILQGLKWGDAKIPADQRETVWKMIEILIDDPDPSREYEADHYENDPNPVSVAINSTRGKALQAVIDYVLWLRRHSLDTSSGVGEAEGVFLFPEEARVILEKHLRIEEEPTLALRSVYGDNINQLVLIDAEWVKDNLEHIFPRDEAYKDYYDAAWSAFIRYCHPFEEVFEILHEQYYTAASQVGDTPSTQYSGRKTTEGLVLHLMVLYWRGKLDSDEFTRVWAAFWEHASDETAAYAIGFIGSTFRRVKDEVEQDIIGRLVELWERRLEVALQSPENHVREMASFGDWYICQKFDTSWALLQLQSALCISRKVDMDREVLERLAELSTDNPASCMKCLDEIIRGDRDPWLLSVSHESVKDILKNALSSEDDTTNTSASALVNYLVSQGYIEGFRDLID